MAIYKVGDWEITTATPSTVLTVDLRVYRGSSRDVVIPSSIFVPQTNKTYTVVSLGLAASNTGTGCFDFTPNLLSVTIPSTVTRIGTICFENQSLLTKMDLPSNITRFAFRAFGDCSFSKIVIPNTVTTWDSYIFQGVPLIDITIGANAGISNDTFGTNGASFKAFYDSKGKKAGRYRFSDGAWSTGTKRPAKVTNPHVTAFAAKRAAKARADRPRVGVKK